MKTFYKVIIVLLRAATNLLAVPVWSGVCIGLARLFQGDGLIAGFGAGWERGWQWSYHTPLGWICAGIFGVFGIVHGCRAASAGSYLGGLGFVGLLLDHTWSLPNTVLASIFATITAGISVDKTRSHGTGRLVLSNGVFSGYDTTIGSVIAGTIVPRHESVHVVQAWICGPFFYPIYIANYIINLIPYWWLIKIVFHAYPDAPIKKFGHYFSRGVYPFTIFEAMAYAVEGSPP